MNGRNKILLISGVAIATIGIIYFVVRSRNKKKKQDSKPLSDTPNANLKEKGDDTIKPEKVVETPNSKPSEIKVDNTTTNQTNDKINYQARGLIHTEKRLADLRALLNDVQPKGDSHIYKPDGHIMGKDATNFLWITNYRNIKSLKGGVINDAKLNKETKDYLLNKLSEHENYLKTIFNPNKYNDKQTWAMDILKKYNDPPNYFYDR